MSASFEDTVFDFDLNFLNQPTTSNTVSFIGLSAAVCRYKTARHYARVLENNQLYTNEGCKQHLIEIRNFIDKVGKLETENRQLEEKLKEKNNEIGDLQNKYEALEKSGNQVQLLLLEKSKAQDPPKVYSNVDKEKKKDNCKTCNKNQLKYDLLDKEVETLRRDNVKLSRLEKENEKLRRENARIPSLAQEILQLRKEVSDLVTPESINDGIKKATAKIQFLQKEIDELQKENSKIGKLEKEIEVLRSENAKAKNFEKEIGKLHRETAKIPKLRQENEELRKECTKVSNLEKEVSVLGVKNAKLTNLERLHKGLCDQLVKIPNKGKDLESLLSRFNLEFTVTGTPPKQGTHKSIHNDTTGGDSVEDEDTVVPLTPVCTMPDKQQLVKTTPEPQEFNDDNIDEVNLVSSRKSSLDNFNIETPSKSLINVKDSSITSTVPVIVYNENQGIHRNKNATVNHHAQNVSIVSICVPKDMTSADNPQEHTTSKSEAKEGILSATVPTIVFNQNLDISCKKNKVENQRHCGQIERLDNDNQSKDNVNVSPIMYSENICHDENVTKDNAQKDSSVPKRVLSNNTPIPTGSDLTATVPTIVYNKNLNISSNDNAVEGQGHHTQNSHKNTKIARERESLELNNSKVCANNIELELENIFSNMKMSFNAVTPIPKTPTRITEERNTPTRITEERNTPTRIAEERKTHTRLTEEKEERISDPTEKLLKCMMLSDKSDKLLLKLKEYMHGYTKDLFCQANPKFVAQKHIYGSETKNTRYNIDKLIQCFETILRSKQILSEDSTNTQPKLQILEETYSTCSNDANNLESVTNKNMPETDVYCLPEDVQNMHADTNLYDDTDLFDNPEIIQDDTHTLQNHQEELSELSSENIESSATQLPEKDIIILHNLQNEDRFSQISKPDKVNRKQEKMRKMPVSDRSNVKSKMYKASDSVRRSNTAAQKKKPPTRGVKKVKCKKHTQLDKLKRRLAPKYKIRRESPLLRKSNIKPKPMPPPKKTVSANDTSASLNDKEVYEKAVKVMAEINSQKSKILKSPPVRRKSIPSAHTIGIEDDIGVMPNSPPRMTRAMSLKLSGLEFDSDTDNDEVPIVSKDANALPSPKPRNTSDKETGITTPTTCKNTLHITIDSNVNNVPNSTPIPTDTPYSKLCDSQIFDSEDLVPTSQVEDPKSPFTCNIENTSGDKVISKEPKELKTSTRLESITEIEVNSSSSDVISSLTPKEPATIINTMHGNVNNDDKMHNASKNCVTQSNSPPRTIRRKSSLQIDINANGAKEQNILCVESDTPLSARSVVQSEINSSGGEVSKSLTKEPNTSLYISQNSSQILINKSGDIAQNSQPQEPKSPLSPKLMRIAFPPRPTKTPLSPRLRSLTHNLNNNSISPLKQTKSLLSPRSSMQNEIDQVPQKILVTPRTKRKISELFDNCAVVLTKDENILGYVANKSVHAEKAQEGNEPDNVTAARRKRRSSSDEPLVQPKRTLRSSNQKGENDRKSVENTSTIENTSKLSQSPKLSTPQNIPVNEANTEICHPKDSILCCMIEKYGVESVKPFAKKPSEHAVKQICEKIEKEISLISELPMNETKNAMNKFVADLRKLNHKLFISGMMKYLTKPERKQELFGKISLTAAPAMTKAEQILLYVIAQLNTHWPLDIVDAILSNIEYTLFRLNRTPEFDVIESMSHFYALLCRYIGAKSRLRLFILDAMYCIQYKSVPLIKQCIEIWMHIIPLAHMGIAKNPLVTCLVYLLHFYKCEDKLNRVQDIRNILSRKYFYQITDWNETKILEMFKNSIKDLKDVPIDKKTLRLALIILAKRHGPRWCQNNIIKNLLQPMIEKEGVSDNVKEFCVSMIGPLMKPYPVDMKIYCEIAMNQLTDILNNNPSPKMEEAAITSMLFINRHNQDSINKILLTRRMKPLSPELEKTLCDYVKTKPLKVWKKHLSIIARDHILVHSECLISEHVLTVAIMCLGVSPNN
ncbi:hypothetical protein HW555_006822 [Spodoptera exigua]|uniref:Uncharacterized protein n=1 Tax=Spodoptera exigua TaxID=7107 RepID=A0A835GEB7_SPOEX|nr:hypothetical protein HW555_006822 [Spodoptera exigua]